MCTASEGKRIAEVYDKYRDGRVEVDPDDFRFLRVLEVGRRIEFFCKDGKVYAKSIEVRFWIGMGPSFSVSAGFRISRDMWSLRR